VSSIFLERLLYRQADSQCLPLPHFSLSSLILDSNDSVNAQGHPTYMGATGNKLTWLITLAASAGFGLFGYDQGVMSGIIGAPQFFETFPAVDPEGQSYHPLHTAKYEY